MTVEMRDANLYGTLSEEKLQAFEERLGVRLPSDYREFLERYNGGIPIPGGFWIREGQDGSEVHQFYGLHDGPKWASLDCYVGPERYGIPEEMHAIGDDGVGNKICIGIKGDNRGAVFFIDAEIHPYDEPDAWEGIITLADSFARFLAGLRRISE
jgi:hypothetical protein